MVSFHKKMHWKYKYGLFTSFRNFYIHFPNLFFSPFLALLAETERLAQDRLDLQRQAERDHRSLSQRLRVLERDLEEQETKGLETELHHKTHTDDLNQHVQALEKQLKHERQFIQVTYFFTLKCNLNNGSISIPFVHSSSVKCFTDNVLMLIIAFSSSMSVPTGANCRAWTWERWVPAGDQETGVPSQTD